MDVDVGATSSTAPVFTHAAQHSKTADQMAQLASDVMEPADIKALRLQLKLDNRTKPGMLAAAAALAADAGRDPAKVFSEHSVPAGSQGRAKALATRIASLSTAMAPASWLPGDALLLSEHWIRAHTSSVVAVTSGALAVSDDGRHATRLMSACIADCDADRTDEIVYDLVLRDGETQKARDDKHRRREEACIRRLDAAAADAHRAKRAREQRSRRVNEAAVRDVLEDVIVQLERQAQQEARAKRLRARAERAETQRLKKRRRCRRAALSGVHPCDFEMIDAVDDTLDFELEAVEAEEALAGDAEIVWSSGESGDESASEQDSGDQRGAQQGGSCTEDSIRQDMERQRQQLELERQLHLLEHRPGEPAVGCISDWLILKAELHQLEQTGWVRGMPEEETCKCSVCRSRFQEESCDLARLRDDLEAGYITTSAQLEEQMKHSEKLLEVLYHFPPKKPKRVKPFDWQCMMW